MADFGAPEETALTESLLGGSTPPGASPCHAASGTSTRPTRAYDDDAWWVCPTTVELVGRIGELA
jgi:hypothetical protein